MTSARKAITSLAGLADAGLISGDAAKACALREVEQRYAIAVTPSVQDLIDLNDTADPIARQYLPDIRELDRRPDELDDPIGDDTHEMAPGLIHRYPDRALLKAASTCPVYCRFCFRREAVGPATGRPLKARDLDAAFAYLAATPAIWEVIVTGGDPLVLSPRRIAEIGERLSAIPHIRVIRWHTRVPVAAPDQLSDDKIAALAGPLSHDRMVYVAIHANHPRELSGPAIDRIQQLRRAGLMLVSQTVLLRGVNDTVETLSQLMRRFVELGVKPYYLHQLDPAPGTSHFRVPLAQAQDLVQQLRGHISGLCQPTFVIDIPGGHGKALAARSDVQFAYDPDQVASEQASTKMPRLIRDRTGQFHRYRVGSIGASAGGAGDGGESDIGAEDARERRSDV